MLPTQDDVISRLFGHNFAGDGAKKTAPSEAETQQEWHQDGQGPLTKGIPKKIKGVGLP